MSYASNLERRKLGVYYFRQTISIDGKQAVKRFSLRTKDTKIAKFLALQIKAKISMIDLKNLKTFEVAYDENNNIKSVKVNDDADAKNLQEFLKLKEIHKAEEHKREIEKLRITKEFEEKTKIDFSNSADGKNISNFYDRLQNELKPKSQKIEILKIEYLKNLKVTEGTKYKYDNFISKLVSYASAVNQETIDKVDRKFAWNFILFMRKTEKKNDKTIKNIFNTLSIFYNHLLMIGEVKEVNPFVGHKLEYTEEKRQPFTNEELEKIFSSEKLKENKKLYFVCLLLVTTGARPNEICQLWTDDIKKVNEIYTIQITENQERDQTVKTKSSERLIYLNDGFLKNGFIEYLNSQNLGMLFDLKKPKTKTYSTFISEDFTKILRELKIENKTMYCFRHTVTNRLKQNFVDVAIRENFVGHESEGTNEKVYSQKHSPENLKKLTQEILFYKEVKALSLNGH
jgi:integrase